MENLINSVIAAEQKAAVPKPRSYAVRRRELRVRNERIGLLIEAVSRRTGEVDSDGESSFGYIFLGSRTRRINQLLCVYDHDGQYIVLIRDTMYCCETLAEAKACLLSWANAEDGIR